MESLFPGTVWLLQQPRALHGTKPGTALKAQHSIPSWYSCWCADTLMECQVQCRIPHGTKPGKALKAQYSIPSWCSCWCADILTECQVHFPLWNTFKVFLWKAPVSPGFLARLWCVTEGLRTVFPPEKCNLSIKGYTEVLFFQQLYYNTNVHNW